MRIPSDPRVALIRYNQSLQAIRRQCCRMGKLNIARLMSACQHETRGRMLETRSAYSSVSSGQPDRMLALEMAIGERAGVDKALLETGLFAARVYPDLPFATTWGSLFRALPRLLNPGATTTKDESMPQQPSGSQLVVRTIAAQLKTKAELTKRICYVCGVDQGGERLEASNQQPASALFMVSGSHPIRTLPLLPRLLNSSVDLLHMATDLRHRGVIPAATQLWASANPTLAGDLVWLEKKVDAGAEVILTQPPLDWPAFERWVDAAHTQGLSSRARLVIGVPMISSAPNLAFWIALANASGSAVARHLLSDFQQQAQRGPVEFDEFCLAWNRELIQKVLSAPGVAGLHIMPITPKARQMTMRLAQEGILTGAATGSAPTGTAATTSTVL